MEKFAKVNQNEISVIHRTLVKKKVKYKMKSPVKVFF